MANIPIRPRQGTPPWVWLLVGLVALLIVLALVDYFVTNLVFNRPAGQPPQDPFSALLQGVPLAALIAPSLISLR